MKIRHLKKIRIGCTDFKIIWDKNRDGGEFSYSKKYITIGLRNRSVVQILNTIIHELKEIIQCEQWTRFDDSSAVGHYMFVYNHDRHDELCSKLAGLLEQFII